MLFPTIMSQYSGELTWTNTPKTRYISTTTPSLPSFLFPSFAWIVIERFSVHPAIESVEVIRLVAGMLRGISKKTTIFPEQNRYLPIFPNWDNDETTITILFQTSASILFTHCGFIHLVDCGYLFPLFENIWLWLKIRQPFLGPQICGGVLFYRIQP